MKKIDYPVKVVCNHLFGEQHSHRHRMVIGVSIMMVGVMVAKIHTTSFFLHIFVDLMGYGIHGLGVTPFLSHLENMAKDEVGGKLEEVEKELHEIEELEEAKN